jgi:hypothetical protein
MVLSLVTRGNTTSYRDNSRGESGFLLSRVLPNLITTRNYTGYNSPNLFIPSITMKQTALLPDDHENLMETMMFASHTMNLWFPLYHYMKMGGSFKNLPFLQWIFEGVPKEYLAPPQDIEVMNDFNSFHEFRQKMITHLYKEYVEDWGAEDDED